MSLKNINKIFLNFNIFGGFRKINNFCETPKNIEIQNFEPQKMVRAFTYMKISEYLPPMDHPYSGFAQRLQNYLNTEGDLEWSLKIILHWKVREN